MAVRIGFDDNRSLGEGETGGRTALPVFREALLKAYATGALGVPPAFPARDGARHRPVPRGLARPHPRGTPTRPPRLRHREERAISRRSSRWRRQRPSLRCRPRAKPAATAASADAGAQRPRRGAGPAESPPRLAPAPLACRRATPRTAACSHGQAAVARGVAQPARRTARAAPTARGQRAAAAPCRCCTRGPRPAHRARGSRSSGNFGVRSA